MKIMSWELLDSECMQRRDGFWSADMYERVRERGANWVTSRSLGTSTSSAVPHRATGRKNKTLLSRRMGRLWQHSDAWVRRTHIDPLVIRRPDGELILNSLTWWSSGSDSFLISLMYGLISGWFSDWGFRLNGQTHNLVYATAMTQISPDNNFHTTSPPLLYIYNKAKFVWHNWCASYWSQSTVCAVSVRDNNLLCRHMLLCILYRREGGGGGVSTLNTVIPTGGQSPVFTWSHDSLCNDCFPR